ncbi:MAG: hypothetical protein ACOZB0_06415 [Pseudomonadota bacterium]
MIATLPFSTRVWLFLYGYPNILGAVLGLAGLVLFFLGLIGPGWPFIVAGLYLLGWLLAWQLGPREAHLEIAREAQADVLIAELDRLIAGVRKRLPEAAVRHLDNLREILADLLPRLAASPLFSEQAHSVEKTVRDYLPQTLENYLRLPPTFAHRHVLKDGQTAQSLLTEQLALLEQSMNTILADCLRDDASALTENGRFLVQKFKPYDFFRLDA